MLPSIRPVTIVCQITNSITGQILPSVAGQQIAPLTIPVAIGDGIQCCAQRAGGVGILRFSEDIAAVVIGVDPRLARRLIVLAGQLVEAVVDVAGGVGAVGDSGDIAPCIVGVGVACPRGLARIDGLAAGIADVIDARLGAGADTLHQPAFRAYRIPM